MSQTEGGKSMAINVNLWEVQHKDGKITKEPHPGQKKVLASKARFKVVVCGRRFGKTMMAVVTILTEALRNPGGLYWYVAPTYRQAKNIAWRMFLSRIKLFPGWWQEKCVIRSKDLIIELPNGSIIELKGAQDPDSLLGSGLDGVVLDEYAMDTFGDSPVWREAIRPALSDKMGWAIFISCVTSDTLIMSQTGIQEIGESPLGYTPTSEALYGKGGFHTATHRYGSPYSNTKRITTKFGFEIEATPNHKLLTPNGWVRMDEMKKGQPIYIQYNQQIFGHVFKTDYKYNGRKLPNEFNIKYDEDLAYLLGLIVSEGYWDKNRVCISNMDEEVIRFLKEYNFVDSSKDGVHWTLTSKNLCEFLDYIGLQHGAKSKNVPKCILQAPRKIQVAFLQGCFDGDGNGDSTRPRVGYTTTSELLAKQLQIMLLNMGILAKRRSSISKPSKRVKVESLQYRLEMENYAAYLFYRDVGFRIQRKMEGQKHCSPRKTYKHWVDRNDFGPFTRDNGLSQYSYLPRETKCETATLEAILKVYPSKKYDLSLLAEEVSSVEDSGAFTYDFCIPDTHQYCTNGFISHNTPRGYNHFYELYDKASSKIKTEDEDWSDWEAWKMPTSTNPYILKKELVAARREIGEDLYSQEYGAEFKKRSGLVFKEFDRDLHVVEPIEPSEVPREWRLEVGIDFGGTHPTAAVFVLFDDKTDTAYVVDEHYESEWSTDRHISAMKAKEDMWLQFLRQARPKRIGDSQARQTLIDYNSKGFFISPTPKGADSVDTGIAMVRARLEKDLITNKPKLYVCANCVNTIREFENYSWMGHNDEAIETDDLMRLANKGKDKPRKVFDDAMDALRYVIQYHRPERSQSVVKHSRRVRNPIVGY